MGGKKRSRGNKRPNVQVIDLKKQIFDLLPKYTDVEIMEMLKMPVQTFYRYKTTIFNEAKKIWDKSCKDGLEYRALQLEKTLHTAYGVCESIALDPDEKAEDRINAVAEMFEISTSQVKLYIELPHYLLDNQHYLGLTKGLARLNDLSVVYKLVSSCSIYIRVLLLHDKFQSSHHINK